MVSGPSSSVFRAGGIITLLTILNIVVGFIFQAAIAAMLGTSAVADNFQLAWSIVTLGATALFSIVPAILVPHIYGDSDSAVVYVPGRVVIPTIGMLLSVALFFLGYVYATGGAGEMLIWASPSELLASLCLIPQAVAYVGRQFARATIGGVANGIGLLVATLMLASDGSLSDIDIGSSLTIGYLVQFVVVAGAIRAGPLRKILAAGQFSVGLIPGMFAFSLATKSQPLVERLFASTGPTGGVAALGFGQKVTQGLLLVGSFGLTLTSTGSIAEALREGSTRRAAQLIANTLAGTVIVTAASLGAFLPFSFVAIQVLFGRGNFSSEDVEQVWRVVLAQVPWVVACAITGPFTSLLYIRKMYLRVLLAAALGIATTAAVSVVGRGLFDDLVVPIASSAGVTATLITAVMSIVRSSDVWPIVVRCLAEMKGSVLLGCAYLGALLVVCPVLALAAPTPINGSVFLTVITMGLLASLLSRESRQRTVEILRRRI